MVVGIVSEMRSEMLLVQLVLSSTIGSLSEILRGFLQSVKSKATSVRK